MAADPTLTRAAFQAARIKAGADVPNLKPLYDSTLDIMQTGQRFVDNLMNQVQKRNEIDRIAKDKQLSGFNKITDDTYSSLYSMDEPMPNKVVNALRTRIKELKEEFELVNTYGKNDTEENNNARIRLLGELKRITNQTVNTRSKFMEMSGDYPDWNNARINTENIDTLKSFLDLKNMDINDNISVMYTNEGLTFINAATGKSFTTAQMREAMPIINKAPQTLATSRANDALSLAARNAENGEASIYSQDDLNIYNSTKADVKGAFLDPIKTNEDYVNAATIKLLPKAQTLEKALETYSVIPVEIIKNMYYTEDNNAVPIGETFARLDRDNDGDIDKDDFSGMSQEEFEVFRANHKEMINAIIKPNHPAFNLETSKEILGNYYANIEEQIYTNTYNTVAENKRKKEGKEDELTDSQAVRDRIINAFKSGKIDGLPLPYGRSIRYNAEEKVYYLRKSDGTEISKFKTPDNDILMQILSAHGVREKDLVSIDFNKTIFESDVEFTDFDPNAEKDNENFYKNMKAFQDYLNTKK